MEAITGQVIRGYEIGELIGEGGFGAVYEAHQPVVDRTVAIKIIYPELADEPEFIRRFETEARTIASLEHPQIVPLYDFWREPNGAFLVMRRLRGGNLRDAMQNYRQWTAEEVAVLLGQIAGAVALAHRFGVVHRDIKPENILLDEDSNAYLSDFGIAQFFDASSDMWGAAGSPAYAAPEQLEERGALPQSDQYSLGILVYELLAGEHPYPDYKRLTLQSLIQQRAKAPIPDITAKRPDLPQELNRVIKRATSADPRSRYADVIAFAKAFREALTYKATLRAEASLLTGDGLIKTPGGTVRTPDGTAFVAKILPNVENSLEVPNPYKGLRAFQETDADLFYGRELLTEHLINRMAEPTDLARFLAVVGPSGSGKSSVIKADVIPSLRRGGIPGSKNWFIVEMTPGTQPFKELEIALLRVAIGDKINILQELQHDERGLSRCIKLLLPQDNSELLLVIDQFEEVFTLIENTAQIEFFLNSLYAAVTEAGSRLRLIITLRADFYDRPLMYTNFSTLMRQRTEVIVPMAPEELERAITAPALKTGVQFETGVVTAIVSEVRGQLGALPLLQYGLTELFDRREGTTITLEKYHSIGGILGALARRSEELYTALDEKQQEITRQLFLRLVTLGEGTEDTRRRALLSELKSLHKDGDRVQQVINLFSMSRLLTFDRDPVTRSPTVEVAHEAILREWSRLRTWLEQSREDVRLQRTLATLASDWIKANKDPSFLLRGGRLEQFETWQAQTNLALSQNERAYLDAAVEERQQREIKETQAKARQEALERQARNRLRLLVGVLLIATIGALALSGVAFTARAASEFNAQISQSLAIVANAQTAYNAANLDLALALAVEANQFPNTPIEAQHLLSDIALAPGTRTIYQNHTTRINDMTLSADGSQVITAAEDGGVLLLNLTTGETRSVFEEAVKSPFVGMSSDAHYLVTNDVNSGLIVIDLQQEKIVTRLDEPTDQVRAIVFSPDNRTLFSADLGGHIFAWDTQTWTLIREYTADRTDRQGIGTLTVSPDGNLLLSSGIQDHHIALWDVKTGELLRTFTGHTALIRSIDFNYDSTIFASGGEESRVLLWDVQSGELLRQLQGHTRTVHEVAFNPTGRILMSSAADNAIHLWNIEDGTIIRTLRGAGGVAFGATFTPDGRNLLAGYADGTLRNWDLNSVGVIWQHSLPKFGLVRAAFSPDGQTVLTSSGPINISNLQLANNNLLKFDAETGELSDTLRGHLGPIIGIHYNSDGTRALTSSADGNTILWDMETNRIVRQFRDSITLVYSAVFSPDESLIATTSEDGNVTLWNVKSGEMVRQFKGHNDSVISVAFHPDGQTILSGDENGQILLWNVENGEIVRRFVGHVGVVFDIEFSKDGQRALSGALDTTMILWDVTSSTPIRTYQEHIGAVTSVAFSPDERIAVTSGEDNLVVLWDVETGERIRSYLGHTSAVTGVAFNPNGSSFVSASFDGTLRLWQVPEANFFDTLIQTLPQIRYLYKLSCEERTLYRLSDEC